MQAPPDDGRLHYFYWLALPHRLALGTAPGSGGSQEEVPVRFAASSEPSRVVVTVYVQGMVTTPTEVDSLSLSLSLSRSMDFSSQPSPSSWVRVVHHERRKIARTDDEISSSSR